MKLLLGDCLTVLKDLPDSSIDSLVTDPPAGISFMGKDWDGDKGGSKQWIGWMQQVMTECKRVLKPGAHALVWAIPRTSHWTATALEDAGFEIRDVITHLFGSGFPKSLDISKAIDKAAGAEREVIGPSQYANRGAISAEGSNQGWKRPSHEKHTERLDTTPSTPEAKLWQGYGTALKPASEHWILCRKPLSEKTVAANVLKWGTGGINIDGCRVGYADSEKIDFTRVQDGNIYGSSGIYGKAKQKEVTPLFKPQGRFPANLVLSHDEGCLTKEDYLELFPDSKRETGYCFEGCAVKMLDEQSGVTKSVAGVRRNKYKAVNDYQGDKPKDIMVSHADSGGASRFFKTFENDSRFLYCAKASKSERNLGCEGLDGRDPPGSKRSTPAEGLSSALGAPRSNHHPTVKPLKLMRYLCRLITPPNGVILDPFMGSGSTGVAAIREGFDFIGIEQAEEYLKIAEHRIDYEQYPELAELEAI